MEQAVRPTIRVSWPMITRSPGTARALHTALSATAHARAGHLDQAAALAQRALFLARPLRSRRVTGRIGQLAQALQPHRAVPDVADFLDQALPMLQPAHAHRPRQ
jgi:hypothetical protein